MLQTGGAYALGALELVRQFVNTLDIGSGTDQLATVEDWTRWAAQQEIPGSATADELVLLRTLREALREGLLTNHDKQPLPEATRTELDVALGWSGVTPALTPRGLTLQPTGDGPTFLAATVVTAVAQALSDDTWSRLKACRDDTCHWAFYDHSRSRTGQWCSMKICGNRNKQERWRDRNKERPQSPS